MKKVIILISVLCIFCLSNGQIIGRQDVVGYTDYDWQFGGPVYSWCRTAPVCGGVHIYWLYREGTNPRNQRYNFYDFSTRNWNWENGINVFPYTCGFGGMDYDPITGAMVGSTHATVSGSLRPIIARDQSPGAALFEYSNGPPNFLWPPVTVTNNRMIHVAAIDNDPGALRDSLFYLRMTSWNTWSTPFKIHDDTTIPYFLNQNIAASKISNKVVVLWQLTEDNYPQRAYYRLSYDGGLNWQPITQLPFPPALPGLTPSFHVSSLFAMFDNQDNFHIVASVSDTGYTVPVAIWHWCPINNPQWSLVYHYAPETIAAYCESNSLFSNRPSIIQALNTGYLYVSWEQFDSLNYEPTTGIARADIWIAESPNNGQTWQNQTRISIPNTTTKRNPCVGGVFADTLVVSYMIDSIAGSAIQSQGRLTRNPIICHFIPLPYAGIEESSMFHVSSFMLQVSPNPFSSFSVIRYSLPANSKASLEIYDVTGRLVKSFNTNNDSRTTVNEIIWNGKDNNDNVVKPGIYFCSLRNANNTITYKLLKTK